jgi:hypothetical protein
MTINLEKKAIRGIRKLAPPPARYTPYPLLRRAFIYGQKLLDSKSPKVKKFVRKILRQSRSIFAYLIKKAVPELHTKTIWKYATVLEAARREEIKPSKLISAVKRAGGLNKFR